MRTCGVYKYYVNEDGATEVPAAILISWNTGSGTPEDIAKTAYISGNLRFAYGITEQQYADQSAQGKRLASNVVALTVTHPERVVLTVYEQDEAAKRRKSSPTSRPNWPHWPRKVPQAISSGKKARPSSSRRRSTSP